MELIDKNKRIAKFMGWRFMPGMPTKKSDIWRNESDTICQFGKNFHYHSSWTELMVAVEKLEEMYALDFHVTKAGCIVFANSEDIITTHGEKKIDSVFEAVVETLGMIDMNLI